jgi:hypothetical protein
MAPTNTSQLDSLYVVIHIMPAKAKPIHIDMMTCNFSKTTQNINSGMT